MAGGRGAANSVGREGRRAVEEKRYAGLSHVVGAEGVSERGRDTRPTPSGQKLSFRTRKLQLRAETRTHGLAGRARKKRRMGEEKVINERKW